MLRSGPQMLQFRSPGSRTSLVFILRLSSLYDELLIRYLQEISKKELDDLGLFAGVLGHIGDGNFHESIMYDRRDPNERRAIEKCVHDMVDRALEMDGTCTVSSIAPFTPYASLTGRGRASTV